MPPKPLPLPRASGELQLLATGRSYVYRAYADDGCLLYVGVSNNLFERVGSHQARAFWMGFTTRIAWEEYESRREAEQVEAHLIRTLAPQYNLTHNWDTPDPECPHPTPEHARELLADMVEQAAFEGRTLLKRRW